MTELKLGKTDQAIQHLQKATQLGPDDYDMEQALGEAYEAKGMQAEAEAAFKKANDLGAAAKPR